MTIKSYFLSADVIGVSLKISWQKVDFLVIQKYALLFLSWTTFSSSYKISPMENLLKILPAGRECEYDLDSSYPNRTTMYIWQKLWTSNQSQHSYVLFTCVLICWKMRNTLWVWNLKFFNSISIRKGISNLNDYCKS